MNNIPSSSGCFSDGNLQPGMYQDPSQIVSRYINSHQQSVPYMYPSYQPYCENNYQGYFDNRIVSDEEYISKCYPENKTIIPSNNDIEKNMYIRNMNLNELHFEDESWVHLKYWEFQSRTGATFCGKEDRIIVDGFCDKGDNNRFSLGSLTSPERNVAISKVLCQIGGGCHIIKVGDNVKIESKCKSPIFIQCPMQGVISGTDPSCVYRLSPGTDLTIYDNNLFNNMLMKTKNDGNIGLINLQQYYQTRISFIKGWGENYRRKSITDSPCWLEILILKPMMMIDNLMMEMNTYYDKNIDSD
uniref:MH2 domain-containing protein n=1 Tax=Parastrongyloides trichosuri TaxID=131310 RepID=A0A0N4Z6K3_PARTI